MSKDQCKEEMISVKKATSRGGRKNKKTAANYEAQFKVYYNNINGFMSKRESLNQILDTETPDIVALCETKLGAKSKPQIQGYETEYLNLSRGKEGLLVAVKEGTSISMENMTNDKECEDRNILAVQLKYANCSVRVIVCHAPQETDKLEVRQQFFERLKLEVERGEINGDYILLVGDMNGRLESENETNLDSPNGELLKSLVDEHHLKVANFHSNSLGKWTRIQQTKKGEKKSVIDYLLLDEGLCSHLTEVIVDESKIITPYWVTTKKGVRSVVSSDHCAVTANISIDLGENISSVKTIQMWKMTEPGLEKFKEFTSTRVLFFPEGVDTTEMYRLWWQHLECILGKCFKKKASSDQTPRASKSRGALIVRNILKRIAVKGKIQREVVLHFKKKLFEWEYRKAVSVRMEKLKNTLSNFSEDEKTPPNAYWKVLKSVRGKEQTRISSLIKNDGTEVYSSCAIKQEAIHEFQHRLRNREPDKCWEEYVKRINKVVKLLMTRNVKVGPDFTYEELVAAIKRLKRKKSPGPDGVLGEFLIEAGEGLLIPLLEIFNAVKNSRQPPDQWNNVLVTIIYKNKGSRKSLVNYRGIFLASIVSKVFERLIKNRTQTEMKEIDPRQAGARPNRGPADNIFMLNAAIDHAVYVGKSIHVTTYDFEQAFDSLWLEDCVLSLQKLDIPDYLLQLIYNLNKKASIQVKTPHGLSPSASINDTVQQGRVLAPDLCSASTAEYCNLNKGVSVGCCDINTLAFVDDMVDLSEDSYDAETAHLEALAFSMKKKIKYNGPKCKGMVVNKKKNERLGVLLIENERMKYVKFLKYLGDIFQENGKNSELVKDRVGRGLAVILRIEAILSEIEFGKHTIEVALLLYHALFISSVLFNAQAWRNFTENDFNELQKLQLRLLRNIVDAPKSISKSFLFLELGVLPIRYEIHRRQLTFMHHIVNLEPDDPVRALYEQMKCFPGERNWLNDVTHSAITYGVEIGEDKLRDISKESFKKEVKLAIQQYAFTKLKEECSSLTKTRNIQYDTYQPQKYLTCLYPSQARTVLKCRARCVDIKTQRPYLFKDTLCRWCNLEDETISHIINCGSDTPMDEMDLDALDVVDIDVETKLIMYSTRIKRFLDMVDC